MNDYDNKFKDYDKKIADLISDKEVESVKANIINISDEIKTVKISMGDIINRLNNNKTEMEEDIKILKDTKINRTDFKNLENEVKHIKDHLKQDDKKIDECKFILYLNNIYDNFFQFSFKTNQWNKRCFAEI